MKTAIAKFIIIAGLLCTSLVVAADKLPETSHDGLVLQKDTELAAVYIKPGADFSGYDKLAILDCFVAFKKNWQRDQRRTANPQNISSRDMDMMQS